MDIDILTNFFFMAVIAATPLLFGTLGEILTQKSGSINLGVEGMMFMGASIGLSASYFYEFYAGDGTIGYIALGLAVIFGFLAGALGGFIYSVLTVTFRANQNVTGLALTIFGIGVGNLIGDLLSTHAHGFTSSTEATRRVVANVGIPFLRDIPILGRMLFSYNMMVYFAIIMALLLMWFLNKTRVGLNLRAVGESPSTADAVGINVTKYKYLAASIGGGICGLGGMVISMVDNSGTWVFNCVAGRGWIAVALVIFAAWKPSRAIFGAILFGGLSVLRLYFPLDGVPAQVYDIVPYAATIFALVLTSIRKSKESAQPKACGTNYFREER